METPRVQIQPTGSPLSRFLGASHKWLASLWIALFCAAFPMRAQVVERYTFSALDQPIPDGNPVGISHTTNIVSGIASMAYVRVKLNIVGEFNGDIYGYLRHSNQIVILLNRPGRTATDSFGYDDTGLNVTFDDAGSGDVHTSRSWTNVPYGSPLTGTWQPDGRNVDPDSVTETSSRTTALAAFQNMSPSGQWTLYLADMSDGGTNQLVSWELEITGGATPTIAWPTPANVVYGTALGASQLNATATCNGTNVPGTFTYAPAAGTVLDSGSNRILSVLFKPADTNHFSPASSSVLINVSKASLTATANSASRSYGSANPAFSGSLSGVVNGDALSASYASAATTNSPIGSYSIVPTVSGSRLTNYSLSSISGTLTVNKAALSVVANNSSRSYGDANPTFTGAIAGVRNSETITVTYLCGATAPSPVGAYAITPSLSGSTLTNYLVTTTNGTLTVSKAALTVTAADASRAYGAANPTFTGTVAGIKNSETITAAYACGAAAVSPVGAYSITPSLSGTTLTNYTVTANAGTLTVSKAPLTVVANNASRPYGDANPTFTGTLSGVQNGETVAVSYACGATTASPVGTYTITPSPSGTTLTNYLVTTTNGALTVGKAALTVTAAGASRAYGAANPTFTGTITGIKNSESIAATYACGATATSPVGAYTITPSLSGATLTNYAVTANAGTLTVSKAALVVSANNASRLYGDANPAFAGTISGAQNGETITATYACGATSASPVGAYPITPSPLGATLANYSVTLNNGTLTVGKAALTVTAESASRLYGMPNPVFTGTITGLKNSDTVTAAYDCSATWTSPVGSYSIVPSVLGAAAANYNLALNNGTLTVTAAQSAGHLTSSTNLALPGVPVTFSMALSAVAPSTGTPSGIIRFKIGDDSAGASVEVADGVASLATNLPAGRYAVVAEYEGDGNFIGVTNTLEASLVVNTPPVANAVAIERSAASCVKVRLSSLLAACSDPDGDILSLSVDSTSPAGALLKVSGDWVLYIPPIGYTNVDSFGFVVSDGHGATANGTVAVRIKAEPLVETHTLSIENVGGGSLRLVFSGIPGRTYTVQYSDDAVSPVWQNLGTFVASPCGVYEYIDTPPATKGMRVYRSSYQP